MRFRLYTFHMIFPLSSFTDRLILPEKISLWWKSAIVHITPCVLSHGGNEDRFMCRLWRRTDCGGVMVIESWYTQREWLMKQQMVADPSSLSHTRSITFRGKPILFGCVCVCVWLGVFTSLLPCKQTTFKWSEVTPRGETHTQTHTCVWTLCFNWHRRRRSPRGLFSDVLPCLC